MDRGDKDGWEGCSGVRMGGEGREEKKVGGIDGWQEGK